MKKNEPNAHAPGQIIAAIPAEIVGGAVRAAMEINESIALIFKPGESGDARFSYAPAAGAHYLFHPALGRIVGFVEPNGEIKLNVPNNAEAVAKEVYGKPFAELDAAEREGVAIERNARPGKAEDILEIALMYVNALGPLSFGSVVRYVREQVVGVVEEYRVAGALNELMREGRIELYDDGKSFSPAENVGVNVSHILGELLKYADSFSAFADPAAQGYDLRVKMARQALALMMKKAGEL